MEVVCWSCIIDSKLGFWEHDFPSREGARERYGSKLFKASVQIQMKLGMHVSVLVAYVTFASTNVAKFLMPKWHTNHFISYSYERTSDLAISQSRHSAADAVWAFKSRAR
jgi:hypothetical protein